MDDVECSIRQALPPAGWCAAGSVSGSGVALGGLRAAICANISG